MSYSKKQKLKHLHMPVLTAVAFTKALVLASPRPLPDFDGLMKSLKDTACSFTNIASQDIGTFSRELAASNSVHEKAILLRKITEAENRFHRGMRAEMAK
jgi:hypothetical protein